MDSKKAINLCSENESSNYLLFVGYNVLTEIKIQDISVHNGIKCLRRIRLNVRSK